MPSLRCRAATAGPRDPTCSTLAALVLAAATAGVPASAAPARPVAASVVSATVARRRRADRAAHPCALAAPRARRALSDRWRAPSRRIWWLRAASGAWCLIVKAIPFVKPPTGLAVGLALKTCATPGTAGDSPRGRQATALWVPRPRRRCDAGSAWVGCSKRITLARPLQHAWSGFEQRRAHQVRREVADGVLARAAGQRRDQRRPVSGGALPRVGTGGPGGGQEGPVAALQGQQLAQRPVGRCGSRGDHAQLGVARAHGQVGDRRARPG